MHVEEIQVAYVNPPKPGKKMGSIKSTAGDYYSVYPDKLGLFTVGQVYSIQVDVSAQGYKSFKGFAGAVSNNGLGAVGSMAPIGNMQAAKLAAPRPMGAPNGGTKSEEMFVMAVVGRALNGAGTVPDLDTLTQWVRDSRQAWRDGFNDPQPSQQAQQLAAQYPSAPNDDIPF